MTKLPTAILLPNYNNEPVLRDCIASILATKPKEVPLWVVDDESTDESLATLRSFGSQINLICQAHGGVVAALLNGLRRIGPDWNVVRVDGDAVFPRTGWVEKLADLADSKPGCGIVGAKVVFPSGEFDQCGANYVGARGMLNHHSAMGWQELDQGQFRSPFQVDAVLGTCMFIRAEVLRHCTFDRTYTHWVEDYDFCTQARKHGFDVWVEPGVEVVHRSPERRTHYDPQAKAKVFAEGYAAWKSKWGWDPLHPDLGEIRRLWGHTRICWAIGEELLDDWAGARYPDVEVLILSRNNQGGLVQCLQRLRETAYEGRLSVQVLDQAGTPPLELDPLQDAAGPIPVRLERLRTNVGCPAGYNWLLSLASAPLLVRMDDDVAVDPGWLTPLVDTLREHPYAGAVGPMVLNGDGQTVQCFDFRYWPQVTCHEDEVASPELRYRSRVNHLRGCCLLYRRKAFDRAGGFDIHFSPTQWDDPDHHIALRAAGYDLICDGRSTVRHLGMTGRRLWRKPTGTAYHCAEANKAKLFAKWRPDIFHVLDQGLDLAGRRIP